MTTVNIYLNFIDNCEEAFNFYKSVFRREFCYFSRFIEMPSKENSSVLSESEQNRVMHVGLPISKETILMGSDITDEWVSEYKSGNNFSISVSVDSKAEADRIFRELSVGGIIQAPMSEVFWGDYFGSFTDKFGINWMIMHTPGK